MSEYKGIKGFQVQTRTQDPTPYAQALADNPYGGVWSSGGGLNTARFSHADAGTLPAGFAFTGGDASTSTENITNAETYDGTSWTEVGDINTARRGLAGAGTADSGFSFCRLNWK